MSLCSLASIRALSATVLVLAQTLAPSDTRADPRLDERAAVIESLVHFVEWPVTLAAISPLEVCVAGDRGFAEVLGRRLKGRTVRGLPMEVRTIGSPASEEGCRVIFLTARQGEPSRQRAEDLASSGVLTIGTEEGFLERGGVVRLVHRPEALRFEINLAAARRANLQIDSRILDLAVRVVHGQPEP